MTLPEREKGPHGTLFLEKEDITRVLNGAYIAERFFGRSCSWFSQKLNGHIKNGKPCEFTPEEKRRLREALYTLSIEIAGIADELDDSGEES